MNLPDTGLIPERRSPFSDNVPGFQTALDSTSLGLFKECPKKYYYQMILGYQPKSLSVHLKFGLLYHYGLEVYDHARAEGKDKDTAVRDMVRAALEKSGERKDGVWFPWQSTDAFKNLWTLIRSLVWYVDYFQHSILRTVILANGKPAVELSFNFEAFELNGEVILLCGHMDRLVERSDQNNSGQAWVGDRKTTKNQLNDQFYRSFTPHNQFTLYSVAGKVVLNRAVEGVMVDAAQVATGFTRFGQRPVPRPAAVLDEWMRDTQLIVGQMYSCAVNQHWPMNDKSCGNYGGCAFAKVCGVAPSFRKAWLEADFAKWEWNPLSTRGDV